MQKEKAQSIINQFELELDAGEILENLTIAQQQMVEIIRAISFGSKIIVMDELLPHYLKRKFKSCFR